MKKIFILTLFTLYSLPFTSPSPAQAALTAGGIAVLDGSGSSRTSFTNLEALSLRQVVYNSAASPGTLSFVFTIYNPSGGAVFHHQGNSVVNPLAGNSNSQISGLSMAMFYTVPGLYRFKGTATLDGATVTQELQFSVSSPNINLIYPPNGVRGLSDNPLIFRWVGSGAASYRIIVDDSAGGFSTNPLHTGAASAGMYMYPQNPTDPLEQLVPDPTVYYWKVEGLNAAGATIAESSIYNFSLKSQASPSRNVAVVSVELTSAEADFSQALQFRVLVSNTGGNTETGLSLKLSLSGVPALESPADIGLLTSGSQKYIAFNAFMPSGQEQGLAVACVDLFDDNVPDNCKTLMITKSSGEPAAGASQESRQLSYQEIWDEILRQLGADAADELDGYTFDSIECADCSAGELNDLMLSLMNGDASLAGASVVETAQPSAALAGSVESLLPEEEEHELDVDLEAREVRLAEEWTGYTDGIKSGKTAYYAIRNVKEWEKLWKKVSGEKTPEVDFGRKMVVGIVAGSGDKADTVRILARRRDGDLQVFDYYMTEASVEPQLMAYVFKVFSRERGKVDFKRLDSGGEK